MTSCLLVPDRLLFIFAVARMFAAKPAAFFKVGGCGSELNFAIKGPGTNHAVVRIFPLFQVRLPCLGGKVKCRHEQN